MSLVGETEKQFVNINVNYFINHCYYSYAFFGKKLLYYHPLPIPVSSPEIFTEEGCQKPSHNQKKGGESYEGGWGGVVHRCMQTRKTTENDPFLP